MAPVRAAGALQWRGALRPAPPAGLPSRRRLAMPDDAAGRLLAEAVSWRSMERAACCASSTY